MNALFISVTRPRTVSDSHRSVLHTNGRAVVRVGPRRKREALNIRPYSIGGAL